MAKEYTPLKLIKNKVFPTYQLQVEIKGNKITPEDVLKICILETLFWIRQKFENLDIPEEIKSVIPSRYQEFDLREICSFRLECGYILEIVYLDTEKSWSLQLVEPELSLPDSQPVPGRVFTTDIAFLLANGTVHCGVRTLVSEPETCEVPVLPLRTGIVKRLVRNTLLKLSHIMIPVTEKPISLNTDAKITNLVQNAENPLLSMPLLIFAEFQPEETVLEQEKLENIANFSNISLQQSVLSKPLSAPINSFTADSNLSFSMNTKNKKDLANNNSFKKQKKAFSAKHKLIPSEKQETIQPYYLYDMNEIAKELMGFAVVYCLPFRKICAFSKIMKTDMHPGSVLMIDPQRFDNNMLLDCSVDPETALESVREQIRCYALSSVCHFKEIHFANDARLIKQEKLLSQCSSQKEMKNVIAKLCNDLDAVKSINKELETTRSNELQLKKKLKEADARIEKLTEENEKIKNTKQNSIQILEQKNALLQMQVEYYASLETRPKTPQKIAAWVHKEFNDSLILHKRAVDLLNKLPVQEVDMKKLCDAIEYLAREYYQSTYARTMTEAQASRNADLKYHQSFIVAPCGDGNVGHGHYSKDYRIKLDKNDGHGRREYPLDMHLKSGRGTTNLIRIYYHYDSYNKRIIIGSLPKHLPIKSKIT